MQPEVLYSVHPKGGTINCTHIPKEARGTFNAFTYKFMIDHLKSQKVTAVQFMPIFKSKGTYWGYDPVSWFEVNPEYGTIEEFKRMTKILQSNGIKVILDVVYNHTAEPMEGVSYYPEDSHLHNITGCGNTVNVKESLPVIMESIDYWFQEVGVDGMRFDLAAVLGIQDGHFSKDAEFFKHMEAYKDKLLIAEPYAAGSYWQLGDFPYHWRELNPESRDAIRAGHTYWCDENVIEWERSINYVTCHDGFTLQDVVSYSRKYNLENGEHNQDGCNHEYCNNHGVEGPTTDPEIIAAREATKKKMMDNLRISSHSMLIRAGDEFGNSQWGNNNAYKHGNHTSYLNW